MTSIEQKRQRVLDLVHNTPGKNTSQIKKEINGFGNEVNNALNYLRNHGLIKAKKRKVNALGFGDKPCRVPMNFWYPVE